MERLEIAAFLENQIRLFEKAFEETDGSMVGADRHEEWEYVGKNNFWPLSLESAETHRAKHPLDWSEEIGAAIVLDPIRSEIDAMKEMVKTLKGER